MWCYLYRAIDHDGNLVDAYLSPPRDLAAKAFCRSAQAVTGIEPDRVTTDDHASYRKAVAEELGDAVEHRTRRYESNLLEQDHRGVKGRYGPMRGFKDIGAAARFLSGLR